MIDTEYVDLYFKRDLTENDKKLLIDYNKELIKNFPFLRPKNRWTGLESEDYDYSYTELDAMPKGWRKAFGIKMCQEIKDALIEIQKKDPEGGYPESYYTTNINSVKIIPYLEGYTITEIKEKYGSLRWYDNGAPEEIYKIVSKYEHLSKSICEYCGQPAKYQTTGWITNLCENCFVEKYSKFLTTEELEELKKETLIK